MKTCGKCKQIRDDQDFHKNRSKANGVDWACKYCKQQWAINHRENGRLAASKYRKSTLGRKTRSTYWHSERAKQLAREVGRRARKRDPLYFLLKSAEKRAKQNGLPFTLTREDFLPLPETCPVYGTPLVYGSAIRTNASATLDKIIPEKGYVKGNVKIVSWRANTLKNAATLNDLKALVRYVEIYGRGI